MVSCAAGLLLLWLLAAQASAITDRSDVQALIQVKAAFDPTSIQAGSCVSTWNFSVDPCDNLFGAEHFSCGIECELNTGGTQRVTTLKLDSSGYRGTLAPAVGNLSSLQYLQVSGNAFKGAIPSSIGQLYQLVILDISWNEFSGALPDNIGMLRNLQIMNVNDNLLSGMLPSTLNSLASLLECRLQHNFFSGLLPDLSSLQQLKSLDLSSNSFSGGVPLRFPPMLMSASFRNNVLTGGLTEAHVEGLNPVLIVLDLSGNHLSGPVDASLFKHPSLQQLNLSNNSFKNIVNGDKDLNGSIIRSQMVAVDISNNGIGGMLPHMFARMPKLASLSMSRNAFSGQIHVSYALKAVAGMVGLEPLQRLMLDGNYLTGPLPALFAKLLPENIMASFADNCLLNCPSKFFFCRGANQKPSTLCRLFNANV
ncbi:hypothetical protein L7F22_010280 [Adiantum nelumboides]|nr:hypothetical protein [Adiantum nelumboides]